MSHGAVRASVGRRLSDASLSSLPPSEVWMKIKG
jgi:hypothetical protein